MGLEVCISKFPDAADATGHHSGTWLHSKRRRHRDCYLSPVSQPAAWRGGAVPRVAELDREPVSV